MKTQTINADPSARWLLLVLSLPTNSATGRMRIWRNLKALGCGSLRDGAYLLPFGEVQQQALQDLSEETLREGGSAWLLHVWAQTEDENLAFQALFDRSGEYATWLQTLADARPGLGNLKQQEITKLLRKMRREYEAFKSIDYFPGDGGNTVEAAWMDFMLAAESLLSVGEPHAVQTAIKTLAIDDYQGRSWATRQHLWVDRVACAWLIRRFIDRQARFVWLESVKDCPPGALGFDFDGAAFTHVGDRVSFEVLLASFDLEADRGLQRLGAMVHVLDIGNGYVPEASGFEAMLAGTRQNARDDDDLLDKISVVLDALYQHFSVVQPSTT
ncbi:chromate resistance exported protein [Undibacterium sp. KW1]|uniref:chromate resistance protein ChrB domain-containing protein n=1 Tax=Undibacterium sp. KW1 TaxID=2058624 RepID=UPI001331ECD1|nr:chromate resistance protein ChrB domain-containing protein [Undibacterium sp. KW1]BBB61985.1 chromate resistance exported protein [Undibacterium sp. KW1]